MSGGEADFRQAWKGLSGLQRDMAARLAACAEAPVPWPFWEELHPDLSPVELHEHAQALHRAGLLQASRLGSPLQLCQRSRVRGLALRGARGRLLRRQVATLLVGLIRQIPSQGGLTDVAQWQDYLPHFEGLRGELLEAVAPEDLGWPFVGLTRYYEARLDGEAALACAQQAVEVLTHLRGPEHPDTATACNNLGALHHHRGHFREAHNFYGKALALREKALGIDHPHLINVLTNLAAVERRLGHLEESGARLERALEICGPHAPDSIPLLFQLAETRAQERSWEEAGALYRRALALCPEDYPGRAVVLNGLAALLRQTGQLAESHELMRSALEWQTKMLGSEHPSVATSLNNWAVFLYADGQVRLALPLLERSWQIRTRLLGPEHPDTVATAANLQAVRQSLSPG